MLVWRSAKWRTTIPWPGRRAARRQRMPDGRSARHCWGFPHLGTLIVGFDELLPALSLGLSQAS